MSRRAPHASRLPRLVAGIALAAVVLAPAAVLESQGGPSVIDSRLRVSTVVSGLFTPTGFAFLGPDDLLVIEKNTGLVRRVTGGVIGATVLDLAVNRAHERGLMGIALAPAFPADPGVYLYWAESTTGADSAVLEETPLLGHRVDRFTWTGGALVFDRNLIRLRAIQADANQRPKATHNGGVIRFGPDGKLYVYIGDVGRRGWMQNLPNGPFGAGQPDDQFGGPEPDAAHLTGVVLRLEVDGSAPPDNPFFPAGAAMGGEVGANIQKIFSYGLRNGLSLAFDPIGGHLWCVENGDDAFDEVNRLTPGMNGGWIQIQGPVARVAQYRAIERLSFGGLQQVRWPPRNIAFTPAGALARLFVLPGSEYRDPELSWKYAIAPAGIGFLGSDALGPQYAGSLFIGASTFAEGGYLLRLGLTGNRLRVATSDPALADRVADNASKYDLTESESLLFGRGFGIVTDIQTGPDGNLYVLSLLPGALRMISR